MEIPFIPFEEGWIVQITPPFGGAVCRFRVKTSIEQKEYVSVYLDCYDNLGYVGEPYWEIYPHEGDCARVLMNDIGELLKVIGESLKEVFGEMR